MIDLYFRDHLVYKELRLPLILGRSPKYGSYVHQCNRGREENPNLLRSKGQGHGSCPQSSKRVVPDHIPRPDYADHPEGYPMSEMKLKGNTYIRSGHQ